MVAMASVSPDVAAALATLRDRWGGAAPRMLGHGVTNGHGPAAAHGSAAAHGAVVGALATVPLPEMAPLGRWLRGGCLEWLVVLAPETLDEGLAMAGALLQGRAVDLLVADLPTGRTASSRPPEPDGPGPPRRTSRRGPRAPGGPRVSGMADRLHR